MTYSYSNMASRALVISMVAFSWQWAFLPSAGDMCVRQPVAVSKCCCGGGADCSCCCKNRPKSGPAPASDDDDGCFCGAPAVPVPPVVQVKVSSPPDLAYRVPRATGEVVTPEPVPGAIRAVSHSPPDRLTHVSTWVLLV